MPSTNQLYMLRFTVIILLSIWGHSSLLMAQSGTIRGTVTDVISNQAIPFANVIVEQTGQGTVTGEDGTDRKSVV